MKPDHSEGHRHDPVDRKNFGYAVRGALGMTLFFSLLCLGMELAEALIRPPLLFLVILGGLAGFGLLMPRNSRPARIIILWLTIIALLFAAIYAWDRNDAAFVFLLFAFGNGLTWWLLRRIPPEPE